jgi:prepilin-type N-terminal cleavage/methylation domain-containing protein
MRLDTRRGFTLIEVIVVLALVTIIGGYSLTFGIDSLQRTTFHSDRDILIAALQRARAQAVGNICLGSTCVDGKSHGVHIIDDAQGNVVSYTIFQGLNYGAEPALNDVIKSNPNTKHTGASDILFEQLSGDANPSGDITLTDVNDRSSTITVGSEGEIRWSN